MWICCATECQSGMHPCSFIRILLLLAPLSRLHNKLSAQLLRSALPMMNTESIRNSILVIDDDPDILDVVSLVLSSEGYSVRTAHDRDEGLALLSNHYHPDALLLDWAMPGLAIEPFLNEVRKLGLHEQTIL